MNNMSNLIQETLSGSGIDNYYITRDKEAGECVVYNYYSYPKYYADNEEKATEYVVLLNAIVKENVEDFKRSVINAMVQAGFKKLMVESTVLEDNDYCNTPIKFKKVLHEV